MTAPRLFTFDTTHHALLAEELTLEAGIACELVPAPPASGAKCNLALETLPTEIGRVADLLERENVPFRLYGD